MMRSRRFARILCVAGALTSAALGGCSRSNGGPSTTGQGITGARNQLIFHGTCDASGAVALSENLFAVGDDENNVLRVYDASKGGEPVASVDVSDRLDLGKPKKKKKNPKGPQKSPEIDIEGATRVGDLAFWITSHGRNSSGKLKPERLRFFATTAPREGSTMEVVGTHYERLLADLLADPRFANFDLQAASERAPKDRGGLNIEGLTARVDGGVFIGFRSPTPGGKALLLALLNPEEVVHAKPARFSDPVLLDLGGLGVRSMSWWHGRYLIVAGDYATNDGSRLYAWDGTGAPELVRSVEFRDFNPEGFFTPEERSEILMLSDDGGVPIDGTECKRLKDPTRKRFRGAWLSLPYVASSSAPAPAPAPGSSATSGPPLGN